MTREEHLAWCKKRAHEYLDHGDIQGAIASMMSNLGKHEETKFSANGILGSLGLVVAISESHDEARRYIDGFN